MYPRNFANVGLCCNTVVSAFPTLYNPSPIFPNTSPIPDSHNSLNMRDKERKPLNKRSVGLFLIASDSLSNACAPSYPAEVIRFNAPILLLMYLPASSKSPFVFFNPSVKMSNACSLDTPNLSIILFIIRIESVAPTSSHTFANLNPYSVSCPNLYVGILPSISSKSDITVEISFQLSPVSLHIRAISSLIPLSATTFAFILMSVERVRAWNCDCASSNAFANPTNNTVPEITATVAVVVNIIPNVLRAVAICVILRLTSSAVYPVPINAFAVLSILL